MRVLLSCAALACAGCTLVVPGSGEYEFGQADAGRDGSMAHDAGPVPDSGLLRDSGPRDGGPDATADAGPCGVPCGGEAPYCDAASGACVPCLVDAHCEDAEPCTLDRCGGDGQCLSTPVPSCIAQVSAGQNHTCARTVDGHVYCWGSYDWDLVGAPRPFVYSSGALELESGEHHACVRTAAGGMQCWGRNRSGEVGDGTREARSSPVPVMGVMDISAMGLGSGYSAVVRDGSVLWWGSLQGWGGTDKPPELLGGISDAVQVAAGVVHACARRATGEVGCWGAARAGELGNGEMSHTTTVPVPVLGITDAVNISAAGHSTCVVRRSGGVACWGGAYGSSPGDIEGVTEAVQVSGGPAACALRSSGEVVCWEAPNHLDPTAPPTTVPDLVAAEIAVGGGHQCARTRATGEVVCWGRNNTGQLGDGTYEDRATPTPIWMWAP